MGSGAVLFLIQELSGNDTLSRIVKPGRVRMRLSGRNEYRKQIGDSACSSGLTCVSQWCPSRLCCFSATDVRLLIFEQRMYLRCVREMECRTSSPPTVTDPPSLKRRYPTLIVSSQSQNRDNAFSIFEK